MSEQAYREQDLFLEGLSCWKEGIYSGALTFFQRALDQKPDDPVISSYMGMTLVKEGLTDRGVQLCEDAWRKKPLDRDLILNLGRACLWAGKRQQARKMFIRGAKVCRNSRPFVDELVKMGMRRKPIIPFFSRDNWLNIWLGKKTYRPGIVQVHDLE
jgi:tetratricopeptide (TPR) repeat protein